MDSETVLHPVSNTQRVSGDFVNLTTLAKLTKEAELCFTLTKYRKTFENPHHKRNLILGMIIFNFWPLPMFFFITYMGPMIL